MKRILPVISFITFLFFLFPKAEAQTNQIVVNSGATTAVNFPGSGCTYNWVNDTPGIGLPASGTDNIGSFTAVNTESSPVTANIMATPVPANFAYIANAGSNTVSVVNTVTNAVVLTIPVGSEPSAISVSPDGSRVYVANRGSNNVSVIDATTNTVVNTMSADINPIGISLSPDGNTIYVANESSADVSVINAVSGAIISSIVVGSNPVGIWANPNGGLVYVADQYSTISVINTTINAVIASIPIGELPVGVSVSPDGSRVYVANSQSGSISVISTATNSVITTFGVGLAPWAVSVSPDGNLLYVSNSQSNTVYVVNTQNYAIVSNITVGSVPQGISINQDGSLVYVANENSGNVSVINTATNLVVATIPVGSKPNSLGNFFSNRVNCNSTPIKFTITVNPTFALSPAITASTATGTISTCAGSASTSPQIQQFTVSGANLTADIIATAPTGFEVSLTAGSGFGNSVTIPQTRGSAGNTVVYIRSAASATTGRISGNVNLTSAGATRQTVAVTGTVNALPTVNPVANQSVNNGASTTAVNFTGTANTFTWINDTPGIGLAASGTGPIGSFMAVNSGSSPVTATITVTPVSNSYIYVASDTMSSAISVINAATNKIVDTIQVGNGPSTMLVNPKYNLLYVENTGLGFVSMISVVNTVTNTVVNISDGVDAPSYGMALSPDGNKLYVASISGNQQTVVVFDAKTMGEISVMNLGISVAGIALSPDGQFLYLTDVNSGIITVVNTTNNTVVNQITVGQLPWAAATNPSTGCVYVTNQGSNTVSVISIATNKVVATIPVGQSPSAISISPDGTMAYVANSNSNTISVINCSNNQVIATISVGQSPSGTSFSTDGTKLYVVNKYDNSISIIETGTNNVINTISVGVYPDSSGGFVSNGTGCSGAPVTFTITVNPTNDIPNQIVDNGQATTAVNFGGSGCTYNWTNDTPSIGLVSSGGGNIGSFKAVNNGTTPVVATIKATPLKVSYIYVANSTDNTISAIDANSNKVSKIIPVGTDPVNLCVVPNGSKLYVANFGSNSISVIDCATNSIVATVSGLNLPNCVKASPDGTLVYVSNFKSNTISIISTSTNQVVGQIPLSNAPLCICISPDGTTLYVSSYEEEFIYQLPSNKLIGSSGDAINWNFITLSKDANSMYGISYTDNFIGKAPLYNLAFAISGTSSPYAIAVGGDPTQTYISNTNTNTVYEFDFNSYKITNTINVGKLPEGVFINADYSKVYVANSGSNTVSVIDTKTNLVVASIPVGNGPSYINGFATLGDGCTPATFTITVNPSPPPPPAITAIPVTGVISTCAGTASESPNIQQLTVSGNNLTGDITATAPTGFEVSLAAGSGYENSITLKQTGGRVSGAVIYVRSAASASTGNVSGNVVLTTNGATSQAVPVTGTVNAPITPSISIAASANNICAGTPVTFTASPTNGGSAPVYQWMVNGNPAGTNSPTFSSSTVANGDVVSCVMTSNASCIIPGNVTSNSITIGVSSPLISSVSIVASDNNICAGTPVTFTATPTNGGGTPVYQWMVNGNPSGTNSINFSTSTVANGDAVICIMTSSAACISPSNATSNSISMNVNPLPVVSAGGNKAIKTGSSIQLNGTASGNITDITWSPSSGLSNNKILNPVASPAFTTTYTLTVQTADGCPGMDAATIEVLMPNLIIPNTFTPNGDGINDTWVIKSLDASPNCSVQIFDRWGVNVYSSTGYGIPWDGTCKGAALPAGTYYYVINLKNGLNPLSGFVAIIR